MSTTALTLYAIEENLLALLDTEEMVEGEDQRLAILDEIAQTTQQAIAKRDNLIRLLRHLELSQAAAKAEIQRIEKLKDSWGRAQERIERYVVSVIERFAPERKRGPKKLEGSLGVLALAKNPDHVEIADETTVPLEYKDVTLHVSGEVFSRILDAGIIKDGQGRYTYAPRKTEIARALKAGEEVPGADLVFGANRLGIL